MPNVPGTASVRKGPKNTLARSRRSNTAVRRVYRKNKLAPKTTQNKKAITLLSKQVKLLELQRYGERQYQSQFLRLTSSVAGTFPYTEKPVAFLVNSFYNGDDVYRGDVSPAGIPSGLPIGGTTVWTKHTFDPGIDPRFQWQAINNQELVSTSQYLPIASKINFRISSQLVATYPAPVRFRISVFKLRKQPEGAGLATLMSMPTYLGAYQNLASDDIRQRNRFSKVRHNVLYDRWVTFNPPSAQFATSKLTQNVFYNHYFKEKPININKHPIPGPVVDQDLISNIPETDLVWCVISCNSSSFVASQFTIDVSRVNTWRDHKGVTSI